MTGFEEKLRAHLVFIYGESQAKKVLPRLLAQIQAFRTRHPGLTQGNGGERVDAKDAILITYGDMVQHEGEKPLRTLATFLRRHLREVVSGVHLLPFFPYSSDDGFSVIDYRQVDPRLGDWEDIHRLGEDFRLMFDAVINHISAQSAAFQGFLRGDPNYEAFFTVIQPGTDLSSVFRPRATPLLTPFQTPSGEKLVWTTFSADQIDLNYANPAVLLEAIAILLFYVAQGAEFIRLDAATFLWKEIGTTCANLPRTHRLIQLMRTVLDMTAPRVALITETNVPHRENIAYFGDGHNEAQMVYNFALPILTLHAFHQQDATVLTDWAASLTLPSDEVTFFNFLASHDGIGITPAKNILPAEEIQAILRRVQALGGYVSYKSNSDGSQSPYELNINYLDALGDPDNPTETNAEIVARFLASQSIMLALRGIPGIYFHSLFGSRNWRKGVEATGRYRTINREKMQLETLEQALQDSNSLPAQVFAGYAHLLRLRREHPAFHPLGAQRILRLHPQVFAVERTARQGKESILCLTNITPGAITVPIKKHAAQSTDVLSGERFSSSGKQLLVHLAPYQARWLRVSG